MKLNPLLLLALMLLLHACSSDPCEETVCGPGTCIEGTCECPNGYYGNSCEENYFGVYAASSMNSANCADDFIIPTIPNAPANSGERICYPYNRGQNCFYYRIELLQDFTFKTTFNQIAVAPGGTESLLNSSFPSGTYTISENTINITFDNGVTQQLLSANTKLFWDISQASDDFVNCEIELEFTKLDL